MNEKPSPVTSILLFAGAALLLFACFSASWFSHSSGDFSSSTGLIRGEFCEEGHCKSFTIFSGGSNIGGAGLLLILTFLLTLAGAVMAGIAGLLLLKPGKTVMSILAMCFASGAALLVLALLGKYGGSGASYGLAIFFLGFAVTLTGSIMGMSRKGVPRPMMMRPGMPMQPGMPYPPYGSQMPPQGAYGAPQGANPYGPQAAAVQGAPCATCSTPTTWVAQYNRWYCNRCQKYV
ncbi:MAG TPA: hypothetical protein VFQ53_19190 [Kofleriaceae bacterium]|nr:hypothetical protein [Kofleriaceae bacterium]